MSKKNIITIFLSAICTLPLWGGQQYYAFLKGDTLRMGNNYMERAMLWNNGAPVTISLTDKQHGKTIPAQGKQPDFSIVKGIPTDATLTVNEIPTNGIHASYLQATVACTIGSLNIERRYRIYADCPAIACDTYLKGQVELYQNKEDNRSNADRKNIEHTADMATGVKTPTLDRLQLSGNHWSARTIEFFDYTDWNDNLVAGRTWLPYRRNTYRGNLLFAHDVVTRQGFFFLKEAPSSSTQLHYPGSDFVADFSDFMVVGLGIASHDVKPDSWTRVYGCVTGIYTGGEQEALTALRLYQKQLRHHTAVQDEMIMLNTWGDRSQDAKIDEAFCLAELDRAARMGITLFQLDDGWQSGKSPNSKTAGGSFKDIWKSGDYWTPNPTKFPHGLKPIVEKGKKLGIRIGLWFNPSIQNDFADWQKDAQAIIGLYKKYGICCFKIDGLQIPTKTAEQNLRRLFDTVLEQTNYEVIFNLDATAGRRGGYHYMNEYGNIFLENRYTDWGNYYPYRTLRNLWMLSRYVPAEKMQIEFLNKWRNADKYDAADPFAPARYSFDYLFAITLAAQPLAWMEASNLPEEAYITASLLKKYQPLQLRFHQGVILPIGEEPSGRSWTGFQSTVSGTQGYLVVYREDNEQARGTIDTWLPEGKKVTFTPVMGSGKKFAAKVGAQGKVSFELNDKNSFALYQYEVKP